MAVHVHAGRNEQGAVDPVGPRREVHLIGAAVEDLLAAHPLQFVVLGQGDEEHTRPLLALAARPPQQVAVRLEFDEALGQLIYAF